jgi:hypothetical protein
LERAALAVLGVRGFATGVAVGLGENAVASVVDLAELARVFVLADVYDAASRVRRAVDALQNDSLRAVLDPAVDSSAYAALKQVRSDRDALLAGLREAFFRPGEVLAELGDDYRRKWAQFDSLRQSASPAAQYEAGKLFGELLLALLGAIGAGTGAAKLVRSVPALAQVEGRLARAAAALRRSDVPAAGEPVAPPLPAARGSPAAAREPARSNRDKALFGQDRGRDYMETRGFQRMTDDKRWNAPGVDDIWRNPKPPPDYVITEYKYGTGNLGATRDGLQMSDDWLNGIVTGRDRLKAVLGETEALDVRLSMDGGRIEKWLLRSDVDGEVSKQILDAGGKALRGATG